MGLVMESLGSHPMEDEMPLKSEERLLQYIGKERTKSRADAAALEETGGKRKSSQWN